MRQMIRLMQMLLPRLDRGDESDDAGMETSPRFTRGGFSSRIKVSHALDWWKGWPPHLASQFFSVSDYLRAILTCTTS